MKRSRNPFTGVISVMIIMVAILAVANVSWGEEEKSYMDQYIGADADMIGSATCLMCHADKKPGDGKSHIKAWDGEEPFANSCEMCHGPGSKHNGNKAGILNFKKMSTDEVVASCTKCHAEKGKFKAAEFKKSKHYLADVSCVSCHTGHSENEHFLYEKTIVASCVGCHAEIGKKYEAKEHGHMNGEAMSCNTCHNPHNN